MYTIKHTDNIPKQNIQIIKLVYKNIIITNTYFK